MKKTLLALSALLMSLCMILGGYGVSALAAEDDEEEVVEVTAADASEEAEAEYYEFAGWKLVLPEGWEVSDDGYQISLTKEDTEAEMMIAVEEAAAEDLMFLKELYDMNEDSFDIDSLPEEDEEDTELTDEEKNELYQWFFQLMVEQMVEEQELSVRSTVDFTVNGNAGLLLYIEGDDEEDGGMMFMAAGEGSFMEIGYQFGEDAPIDGAYDFMSIVLSAKEDKEADVEDEDGDDETDVEGEDGDDETDVEGEDGDDETDVEGEDGDDETDVEGEDGDDETGAEVDIEGAVLVGECVEKDGLELYFVSAEEFELPKDSWASVEEGQKILRFEFTAVNKGEGTEYVNAYDIENCMAGDVEGESMTLWFDDGLSATLTPGRMTKGAVYYAVPEEAETAVLKYQVDWLHDEYAYFVYNGDVDSEFELEKNTEATEGAVSVGEAAEGEFLKMTLLSCSEVTEFDSWSKPADGYKVLCMEIEVENLTDEDQSLSDYSFSGYADGFTCKNYYSVDNELEASLSAKGDTATGVVAFQVPEDTEVFEIEFKESYWNDTLFVFLYEE